MAKIADKYKIDVITLAQKSNLIKVAEEAIGNLRKKIAELNQMIANKKKMQTFNKPYEVAYYIKEAIGIPNRQEQDDKNIDVTNGAKEESYYILFIPTQKQDIVVDLRTTDHRRGEEWSDIIDGGEHPNIRATTIVKDTEGERPKTFPLSPYKANGCKIKRIVQEVPMKICGTPEQVINYLNTLIALFQNGQFGKYKKNKMDSTKAKDKVPQNISVDKDGNWVSANGCGADYVSENKQYNSNRKMKQTIKLRESELKRMIAESVRRVLRESNEMPYLSDQDIHKQYEGFEIEDFTIKPRQHRYDGTFGWDVGFEISFPNVDHPDFDDSKWENVDVWDEDGKRMAFDGWYPEDIQQQLITMIRSEIKKHAPEMDAFKNEKNKKEEEQQMEMDRLFNLYKKRKGISNESTNRRIDRIVSESIKRMLNESDVGHM